MCSLMLKGVSLISVMLKSRLQIKQIDPPELTSINSQGIAQRSKNKVSPFLWFTVAQPQGFVEYAGLLHNPEVKTESITAHSPLQPLVGGMMYTVFGV